MGCGASADGQAYANETERPLGPDGKPLYEWWVAGDVLPGGKSSTGEPVPVGGPFGNSGWGPEGGRPAAGTLGAKVSKKILYGGTVIGREGEAADLEQGSKYTWQCGDPLYCRAFFTHGLPSFAVGWARLELSQERPHYNTRKMAEKEAKMKEQGKELDYSKRKKYFLYPESIKEIGLFLTIDGKHVVTPTAVSGTSWACDPIEDAFFTFSPAAGSLFGERGDVPENSLAFYLRPKAGDPVGEDIRWLRLHAEFLRALSKLSDGSHELSFEVRYRYGNWKFVAWNEVDCRAPAVGQAPSYRYSDEERDDEAAISVGVASGSFKVKLSKDDKKMLLEELPKVEEAARKAEK